MILLITCKVTEFPFYSFNNLKYFFMLFFKSFSSQAYLELTSFHLILEGTGQQLLGSQPKIPIVQINYIFSNNYKYSFKHI